MDVRPGYELSAIVPSCFLSKPVGARGSFVALQRFPDRCRVFRRPTFASAARQARSRCLAASGEREGAGTRDTDLENGLTNVHLVSIAPAGQGLHAHRSARRPRSSRCHCGGSVRAVRRLDPRCPCREGPDDGGGVGGAEDGGAAGTVLGDGGRNRHSGDGSSRRTLAAAHRTAAGTVSVRRRPIRSR